MPAYQQRLSPADTYDTALELFDRETGPVVGEISVGQRGQPKQVRVYALPVGCLVIRLQPNPLMWIADLSAEDFCAINPLFAK